MSVISDIFQQNQQVLNGLGKNPLDNLVNKVSQQGPVYDNSQWQQVTFSKPSLTDIYNQAMANNTPAWAMALSNAMPAIGEIVSLGATKGAFNQGKVAESLERQKQRQQAYNQYLQQNEQNQARDFVQMAKEQLDMARADEDKQYNRQQEAAKAAYQQWLDKQNIDFRSRQQNLAEKENEQNRNFKTVELAWKIQNGDKLTDIEQQKIDIAKQNLELQKNKIEKDTGVDVSKFDDTQKLLAQAAYEEYKNDGDLSKFQAQINSIKSGQGLSVLPKEESSYESIVNYPTKLIAGIANAYKPQVYNANSQKTSDEQKPNYTYTKISN